MKRIRLAVFVAIVIAQVLVVGNMARSREVVLESGEQIVLATAPVDPRDLFRGDYVILNYDISQLDRNDIDWATEPPWVGQQVLVVLARMGGIHSPIAVIEANGFAETAIRGEVTEVWGHIVVVEYGIEAYFVPEGRGWEIEQADSLDVVVAVDDEGHAVIDHLVVDGERWSESG